MPTTADLALPYPGPGDPDNVPADIYALAARIETVLKSGIYTPTTSGATNLDSATAHPMMWTQIGNIMTVDGLLGIDITAAASWSVKLSLPVASNLGGADDLSGLVAFDGYLTSGQVSASTADDKALVTASGAPALTALIARVHFSYRVI